jgi:hypothetical protein
MNKYYIEFLDTEGDINNLWIYANSIEEAKFKVISQYWNFHKLITCYETV